jgi:outer membrane protein assembly factor BamB
MPFFRAHAVALLLLALASIHLSASDWPQLLGPTSDAVYAGPPLAEQWPKEGPRVVWSAAIGEGYSSPVVAAGKLVVCHRSGDNLVVDCHDAKTGRKLWTFEHGMKFQDGAYQDSGPRPTPAIRDGKVFVHNTDGYLVCLDANDGRKLWSRHAKGEFKSSATWHGCCASPLATDKAVILLVGSTNNAGVVAFAAETGQTLWQVLDDKASASSPVLANLGGRPQVLVVTRSHLRSLQPDTGQEFWSLPTPRQSSGNVYAASPVVFGDQIFLSGWYKLGAELIQVADNKPLVRWKSDAALSTHYAAAIHHQGYLYGFHGHGWENLGPSLRCVDLATGKVMWEKPKSGSGTIVKCGENLLILTDGGELQLGKADPRNFTIKARAQVLGRNTRSYPAVADGFVYARGARKLVALDLRVSGAN